MRRHHQSWCDFATDPEILGIHCDPGDIILVRGAVKTSAWAVAAFIETGNTVHEVAFNGQFAPLADVGMKYSSQNGTHSTFEHRSGPYRTLSRAARSAITSAIAASPRSSVVGGHSPSPPSTPPEQPLIDQCVFLSHYKIKYRRLFPKKIIANAEPGSPPTYDPSRSSCSLLSTSEVEIEVEPTYTSVSLLITEYSPITHSHDRNAVHWTIFWTIYLKLVPPIIRFSRIQLVPRSIQKPRLLSPVMEIWKLYLRCVTLYKV